MIGPPVRRPREGKLESDAGQDGILRPVVYRPGLSKMRAFLSQVKRRVNNAPHDAILPHRALLSE
jgi:hypothetical protein